jgi:hypothetical protein
LVIGAGDEEIPTPEMGSNVCYNVVIKETALQTNPSYDVSATKSREVVSDDNYAPVTELEAS